MFMYDIAGLKSTLHEGALEIPTVTMGPCDSATFATHIEARLISPSASDFVLNQMPSCVHADRPFELEFGDIDLSEDAGMAESVASWISAHARLQISVEAPGQPQVEVTMLVNARPSAGGWIARALVSPSVWANATSVTVVSLTLADRPVPCHCLPATLRVGYNHAPAGEGAVFAAARAGDVPALEAALDAGGSTEEADRVRGVWGTYGAKGGEKSGQDAPLPFPSPFLLLLSAAGRQDCFDLGRRQRTL